MTSIQEFREAAAAFLAACEREHLQQQRISVAGIAAVTVMRQAHDSRLSNELRNCATELQAVLEGR